MEINLVGLAAGLATFLAIWFGHVSVRKLEYISPSIKLPAACFMLSGFLFEASALFSSGPVFSAVGGILGVTAFWDAYEFFRQEERIARGHAPANPRNPRHAHILTAHPSATTLDLLKREPAGRLVNAEEAAALLSGATTEAR